MLLLVSGATTTVQALAAPLLGTLVVPKAQNKPEALTLTPGRWAMDNGAFSAFDAPAFLSMLALFKGRRGCLFATCPDVVSDAVTTLQLFQLWAPVIRTAGFPVALVAQDGLTVATTPWGQFDCLFIGGSTAFKLGPAARTLVAYAKAIGVWVHMGRVNSRRRIAYAVEIGCDSCDGTGFSRWAKIRIPLGLRWIQEALAIAGRSAGDRPSRAQGYVGQYTPQRKAMRLETRILEFDYAGIEQVVMGWCFDSPQYIRIAKLGTHALVASHLLNRPADLSWSDQDLKAYFKEIKSSKDLLTGITYDQSKRTVHGTAYGLTTHGMIRQFPKTYRSLKDAEKVQAVYFSVAPEVPAYHEAVRRTAYDQHFLGGPPPYTYDPAAKRVLGHPYGYRHDFYAVLTYTRLSESQRIWREKRRMPTTEMNGIWYGIDMGEDSKRVVAFNPQSIARGVLTEAALDLFLPDDHPGHRADLYIGDAYYGRTPLRAPIHDSLLLEVPVRAVDKVAERVFAAMLAGIEELPCPEAWGIGPYLSVGVDGKIGDDWDKASMEELSPASVAGDRTYFGAEERDSEGRIVAVEEDLTDLETAVA